MNHGSHNLTLAAANDHNELVMSVIKRKLSEFKMKAKMRAGICSSVSAHENGSCFSNSGTVRSCHQIHLPKTTV